MTTNPTPAPAVSPKKILHPAVFILSILVVALSLIAITIGISIRHIDDSRAYQSTSMQQSLESHGFKADSYLAQRVSDGCRYKNDSYPISTSIVYDYNGKKSVITFMCDGNAKISDFAAVPAS